MKTLLTVIGLVFLVASAIYLYFGSREMPWSIRSFGGDSDREQDFQRRRKRMAVVGFILLGVGTILQLIALLFLPDAPARWG